MRLSAGIIHNAGLHPLRATVAAFGIAAALAWVAAPSIANGAGGWIAEGRPEYRTPPLTVECRARVSGKDHFNILVASDTKSSGNHWELFTMAGKGTVDPVMTATGCGAGATISVRLTN